MYTETADGRRLAEWHARLLGSLANPKRMQACVLLSIQELDVGTLARALDLSQSATSQHLSRLFDDGIVAFRSQAQHRFYSCRHAGALKLLEALADVGGEM